MCPSVCLSVSILNINTFDGILTFQLILIYFCCFNYLLGTVELGMHFAVLDLSNMTQKHAKC